ncbi:glycine N-acyltransferase-like [Discoglossus pictus]
MLSLQTLEELQLLKQKLRTYLPDSLKVYGSLISIIKGNPFQLEVIVDSWPDFGAVVTRPLNVPSTWDPYTNSYSLFLLDVSQISSVLELIDWKQAFEVQTMNDSLGNVLMNEASQRGVSANILLMKTYYQEMLNGDYEKKDYSSLRVSSLSVDHALYVDDTWKFGGSSSSLDYVKLCLKTQPSSCVLDQLGIPMAWVLCDQYGAMRMLYTMPKQRRRGFGTQVSFALMEVLRDQGRPVYCHVEEENTSSQLMFKGLGLQETTCKLLFFRCDPGRERQEHATTGHEKAISTKHSGVSQE